MAIIRCPYCHAIIDENDKYCNNCGTQLLFPEDEAVEEEIPGEKILDAEEDEEEKDYELRDPEEEPTADLKEEEKEPHEADEDDEEDDEDDEDEDIEEEELESDDKELESDEEETEEVVLVDESLSAAAAPSTAPAEIPEPPGPKGPAPEEETQAYPVPPLKKEEPKDETRELPVLPAPPKPPEALPQAAAVPALAPPPARPAETAAERPPMPATFDTRELEGIGRTVDLSKERLDRMIEVMAEKQKEPAQEKAPPLPEKATGTLPPWADRIRGAGAPVEREDTRDTTRRFEPGTTGPPEAAEAAPGPSGAPAGEEPEDKEEVEIFPHRRRPGSGIGIPEGVAQADLPFGPEEERAAEEEEAEGGDEAVEEEEAGAMEAAAFERAVAPPEPARAKAEEPRAVTRPEAQPGAGLAGDERAEEEAPRPPFNFSTFFKAKAFDVLFIGVFWLVALWVAARSMEATLFELLSVTSTPVLLLYAAFLGTYFFLFKFFLGETLGDRLFKDREERE